MRQTLRRRRAAAALPLLSAALLESCGDGRFHSELDSELYAAPVRAAVERVVDAGRLPYGWHAHEVDGARLALSLGARDGDERLVFGRIADLALSAAGDTVFVLDAMEREVRAFSARGELLFRFGRRGKGPGEYEDPVSIARLPWSGAVAVWDAALQRLTVLSPGGEVRSTATPLRQSEIARTGRRLRAYGEGFLLEVRSDPYTVPPAKQRGFLVRLDTLGRVRDTLLEFAVPPVRGSTQQGAAGLVSETRLWAPQWTPEPRWDVSPDGEVAFAPGGPYEVYRLGADRGAVVKITRPWKPEKLTRRERMLNLRGWREHREPDDPVPLFVRELARRKSFARVRPAVMGVLAAGQGRVWARRFSAEDHWEGYARTWDAYGAYGGSDGVIRFPAGFHPVAVAGGRVWGFRQDELDVDYLEAYSL